MELQEQTGKKNLHSLRVVVDLVEAVGVRGGDLFESVEAALVCQGSLVAAAILLKQGIRKSRENRPCR